MPNRGLPRVSSCGCGDAGGDITGYKDGAASSARFKNIWDIALGAKGAIYVADFGNHRIRLITPP